MPDIKKIENEKGLWLFVAPIRGLLLSKAINYEITVNKITFIANSKLPYVRKRFGFPFSIKELRENIWFKDVFEKFPVSAICKFSGNAAEYEKEFLKIVKNELSILTLSQLGYHRRWHNASPSVGNDYSSGDFNFLMLNTLNKSRISQGMRSSKTLYKLELDINWQKFQKRSFFYDLIKLLQGKPKISAGWFLDIQNAALLAGQSQTISDLPNAFLWNMIAIETLLTHQGDKYSVALPERVEAFIGWTNSWSISNFEQKIKTVYKKRCDFVHSGRIGDISIQDLLFTDVLIINIFYNILKHINIFTTKADLINFSEKIKAAHILGVDKQKIRPKTIAYIEMIYTDKDRESI